MTNSNEWIDITYPITNGMAHWPGDVDVQVDKLSDMDKGNEANVTKVSMSAHTGTHMDAPKHFINQGKTLDHLPFDALIGPVKVIPISNKTSITQEELTKHNLRPGERILFKTANSETDWTRKPFNEGFVYISTEAGLYMVEKGIRTIGIDYLSVGGMQNGPELHRILLEKEIWLIEGLDLRNVSPGNYEMVCLPIKIAEADGAPVRALLKKI
ncbi:cyclase family protein [Cytophagaceae bacterium ABcell3]|nr:cyclase family protein [Cytophagaceae bacterium ABcell3]